MRIMAILLVMGMLGVSYGQNPNPSDTYASSQAVFYESFDWSLSGLRVSFVEFVADSNENKAPYLWSQQRVLNAIYNDSLEALRVVELSSDPVDTVNNNKASRTLSTQEILYRCYDDSLEALRTVGLSADSGSVEEVSTKYYLELDTLDFDTVSALRNVTQVFTLPARHEIALFATEIFEDGGEDFDLATNDDSANVAFVAGASGAGVGSSRLEFASLDTLDVFITKHGATSADSFVVTFITFDADDLDAGTHEAVAFDSTYELSVDTLTTDSSIVATLPELTDVHSIVVAIDTATTSADTMIVELGGREIARFELDVKTTMTIATPNAFIFTTAALAVRLTSTNTGHVRIRARGIYYEN